MKFSALRALAFGACFAVASSAQASETLILNLNASHYLYIPSPIVRVATGSSDIISVVDLKSSKNEILVVAKNSGTTSMLVWTEDGRMREYTIIVSQEDVGTAAMIQKSINLPHVTVKKIDNRVLLTGKVKNQYEREYAIKIAQLYVGGGGDVNSISNSRSVGVNRADTGESISNDVQEFESSGGEGNIIDLLELEFPTQVQFEAQIIDIDENDAKDLGISHSGSYGHTERDGVVHSGGPNFRNNPYKWFFSHRDSIDFTINALVTKGKARILSRPYITTLSGEAASIHIGGTVPVQVIGDNGYDIRNQDYGIILHIVPNVDAKNRITSSVTAIVSSIDESHSTSSGVALLQREATAVISVDSGTTMVIGGLIDSRDSKSISKIPLLGDIPILGEFFKYTAKRREHRELLILITPTLITANDPVKMTDDFKKLYDEGRQFKADLNEVDVNEAPPPRSLKEPD